MADVKRVYTFGNKEAEGNGKMRELLGGKGANLAEMNLIGIPVPPGFTITTEVCSEYYAQGREKVVGLLRPEVEKAMKNIEKLTGMKFGDKEMPLLVSVRSGARASMPGMMDTILNLGMNDQAVEAVAKRTGNPRFAWDSYRRFVQMYGDVVLGMKPESKEDHDPFEVIIEEQKEKRGVKNDTDLTTDDLKELVGTFKKIYEDNEGRPFPQDPKDQLIEAVKAAGYTKVVLRPLMVVAGDHANNDMAGDDADSWKSMFNASGAFESVDTQIAGLGQIPAIQELYVAHTGAVINQ